MAMFLAVMQSKQWGYWPYQWIGYQNQNNVNKGDTIFILHIIYIYIFFFNLHIIYIYIYISYISMYPHLFFDIVQSLIDKPDGSWMNEDTVIVVILVGTWFGTSRCTCNSATGWGISEMGWDDGPVHLTVKGTGEVVPCTSWEVEQRPGARTKAVHHRIVVL